MTTPAFELRYALRRLRRAPGFTAAALLTLALATGGVASMAGVLRATLLNSTPFPHPEQLVVVRDVNLRGERWNGITDLSRATDLKEASAGKPNAAAQPVFTSVSYVYYDEPSLIVPGALPVATTAGVTSGDFFTTLGTRPLLGRVYSEADNQPSAPDVAVISAELWRRAFGGNPGIIGSRVTVGSKPSTIVGVMPRSFDYGFGLDIWRPAKLPAAGFGTRGDKFINITARLAPGVSVSEARAALSVLAARLARSYPATDADWGFSIQPLRDSIFAEYRPVLLLLSGAFAVVLVIGCINVAGLQLSRYAALSRELAIQRALGSSQLQLLRQLLLESALLLAGGVLAGLLLAGALLRLLPSVAPHSLLPLEKAQLDWPTVLAASMLVTVVGLLCCLLPIAQTNRLSQSSLGGRSLVSSSRRLGHGFAGAQIALALVMLSVTASLLTSLHRMLRAPLGFSPEHVVSASVHLPFGTKPEEVHRLYQQLGERFAAIPGTVSVGAINALPFSSFSTLYKGDIEGRAPTPHRDTVAVETRKVTPGYAATMAIPLTAGRMFTEQDSEPHMPFVVLVNKSFARQYFPHESPLGHTLVNGQGPAEIVGVLGDIRGTDGDLADPARAEVYLPEQGYWPDMHFLLRTRVPGAAVAPAMRQALASLDRGAALGPVEPLDLSVRQAFAQPRLGSGLLSALSALALLLVVTGVYGVCAYAATRRGREMALRLALGASRGAVFRLLVNDALRLLLIALPFGAGGALLAGRVLAALNTGVVNGAQAALMNTSAAPSAEILPALAVAFAILTAAVFAAAFFPARRAAGTDPARVLAAE